MKRITHSIFFAGLFFVLPCAATWAQSLAQPEVSHSTQPVSSVMVSEELPPISTECPSVGSSPDVIPRGSLQVETGVTLNGQPGQYITDGPESLIRLGLFHGVELRYLFSDFMYQTAAERGTNHVQSQDAQVSAKFLIPGQTSLKPKSVILGLSLSDGSKDMTSSSYDPSLNFIWAQAFHKAYSLNEGVQATLTTQNGARRPVWASSIGLQRSLSDRTALYAEYAPMILTDSTMSYEVDGGFTYLVTRLLQLDAITGYIRDAAGLHYLVSFGYSFRRDGFLKSSRSRY